MTNKKILKIALSVTIVHFILTSVIGHYIAVQIGTQIGQIVIGGLQATSGKTTEKSEEEATTIYQDMKSKRDAILENWKISELMISLPAKPLLNPLLKKMSQNRINKVISKEITREQFRRQALISVYTANFLNSLSFGFLVYIMLRILHHFKARR